MHQGPAKTEMDWPSAIVLFHPSTQSSQTLPALAVVFDEVL